MITRDFADEAAGYQSVLTEIRRDLHQIPEFGIELPKTRERILASIHGLGEIHLSERQSSIVLHIKGAQPGPTVLLRADMDALAVTEATGLDFASTNGYMHACGHDLHMAIGIGAAHLVATHKDKLKGDVIIWFQPGEEGHGGADIMLEENLHMITGSKPIAAYGIHVTSSWQAPYTFGGKSGALMASASDMLVTFKGRGGHGSSPWMAKDPISVMNEAIAALQTMVTKRFNAFDPVVVNVGWVRAGDEHTTNVIPETASFGATIRTFSPGNLEKVQEYAGELLDGIAQAFDVEVTYEIGAHPTEVVMNDPAATDRVRRVVKETFGEDRWMEWPHPIAGAEDFGSIVREIPGAFIFLGASPDKHGWMTAAPNHSNYATFDEGVLPDGAALLAGLAFEAVEDWHSAQ
ncbi:MAG: M20 family metallopeptidase [Rhodoluna sp.]|nr:M20 family metallopeptidase [Rhodoluna sp.]